MAILLIISIASYIADNIAGNIADNIAGNIDDSAILPAILIQVLYGLLALLTYKS